MVELFNNLHNVNVTFSLFYILHIHRHTSHAMDVRIYRYSVYTKNTAFLFSVGF